MNELEPIVDSRHPAYVRRAAEWDFFFGSYKGGRDYTLADNLFSHRLEHKGGQTDDWDNRRRRSYYLNYCQPVVDTYTAFLFRENPRLEPADALGTFARNVDGRGTDLFSFMRKAATLSSIFGHVIVGVDAPSAEGDGPGEGPYFTLTYPQNFLNWEIDRRGELLWCLVREAAGADRIAEADGLRLVPGRSTVYRLWTRNEWFVLNGENRIAARGEHGLGVVPFVTVAHRDVESDGVGESLIADIAYVNREIYNLCSLLGEILTRQTFSQLVAQGSADEYGEIARLGTSSIFLYPDGKNPPQFIGPDAAQAEVLIAEIDGKVSEIYRMACLQRGSVEKGSAQSGVSKAYDFLDTNQALIDKAARLSCGFEKCLNLARRWMGLPETEIRIVFPRDFGVERTDALIGDALRLKELDAPQQLRTALLEQIAGRKLADRPSRVRERVLAAVTGRE